MDRIDGSLASRPKERKKEKPRLGILLVAVPNRDLQRAAAKDAQKKRVRVIRCAFVAQADKPNERDANKWNVKVDVPVGRSGFLSQFRWSSSLSTVFVRRRQRRRQSLTATACVAPWCELSTTL